MTFSDISTLRLHNQLISSGTSIEPGEVVQRMVAMQAQDYLAALWAIGLRTSKKKTEADIEEAISDRKIVRTWPMRGTLHFVAPEDVRWMLKLLTPRIIRGSAGRHRQLELDEDVFNTSRKLIEKALEGNNKLTRSEFYEVLEAGGVSTEGQRGYHIIWYLAQHAVICWGPRQGKQHTLVLLDEWIPEGRNLKNDEALAELASRYIKSHGPSTEYDFAYWSGLTVTLARKGFEMTGDQFEKTVIEDQTYWFSEQSSFAKKDSSGTFLLPGFDEIICGYKNRSAILKSEYQKSIILRNGIFKPIIVTDGRVSGSWKRTLKKDKVIIQIGLFEKFTKRQREEIISKVMEYGNFLGLQTEFDL